MSVAAVFNYGLCCYDNFIESQKCDRDTQFECPNHSKYIKIQFLCDGLPNCADGSDEASSAVALLHK